MEWLTGALSSAGLGSAIGLIGGIAEKFIEIRVKRLEYKHEEIMRNIDVKESELDRRHELAIADKQIEREEVEGEIRIAGAEMDAFTASQEGAGKSKWLTFVRASITAYMLLAATALTAYIWVKVGGADVIPESELVLMLDDILRATIFLTVTCITWWFAARPSNIKFKR